MSITAMKQALEALELAIQNGDFPQGSGILHNLYDTAKSIRQAIAEAEKQEPVAWMTINAYGEEDDIHYENPEGHLLEGWTYKPLYTCPQPTAKAPIQLRRGDILRCIETDELCTVWATSTTHKTLVKWSGNDFTDYTAEQIGELFWVEPKAEQEPVMWEMPDGKIVDKWGLRFYRGPLGTPLYTHPQPKREWVGLTDEDDLDWEEGGNLKDLVKAIEAKLKEKNT